MKRETQKRANETANAYTSEGERDAYLSGFDRGFNAASWQDLPEIGSQLWTDTDGKVTVTEDNQWDVVQSLASEAEGNDRQFTPFEFTAKEFNDSEDSEALWEAFDTGIADGILANIEERKS